MLLTKLLPETKVLHIFWRIKSTIVTDDIWFGKCAGVHKLLIHNPKPSAGLLPYFTFRTTCLGVNISYIFGSYVHSKPENTFICRNGGVKLEPCTITIPATLEMENVEVVRMGISSKY